MTSLPQTDHLVLELQSGWLTIWLNSPENRNALSEALSEELMNTLISVRQDRSVRGITLRGKGGIFCAGGDLKSFSHVFQAQEGTHTAIVSMNKRGGELFSYLNSMPQVVVALIEGAAVAGGLGMACCADIVAVTEDAKFSLTETQLGITPAQIAPYIIQRFGLNTARRLMMTGARFKGKQSQELGLADYIAKDSFELESIEILVKEDVLKCAPNANAVTKDILLAAQHLPMQDMQDYAANRFADCMLSDEGREGITAFIQKRSPKWAEQG